MNTTAKRMTLGIMLALTVWGIYLAIGATGMFVQESMMDPRKSVIVVICVALFLGLWAIVLNSQKATVPHEHVNGPPWSKSGLATIGCAVTGSLLWVAAVMSWKSASLSTTTVLGWLAALFIMGSATSGIIALSSIYVRRGKWLGMLGLVGFLAALIVFVARMTP